jgi:hypothetical protein
LNLRKRGRHSCYGIRVKTSNPNICAIKGNSDRSAIDRKCSKIRAFTCSQLCHVECIETCYPQIRAIKGDRGRIANCPPVCAVAEIDEIEILVKNVVWASFILLAGFPKISSTLE